MHKLYIYIYFWQWMPAPGTINESRSVQNITEVSNCRSKNQLTC